MKFPRPSRGVGDPTVTPTVDATPKPQPASRRRYSDEQAPPEPTREQLAFPGDLERPDPDDELPEFLGEDAVEKIPTDQPYGASAFRRPPTRRM